MQVCSPTILAAFHYFGFFRGRSLQRQPGHYGINPDMSTLDCNDGQKVYRLPSFNVFWERCDESRPSVARKAGTGTFRVALSGIFLDLKLLQHAERILLHPFLSGAFLCAPAGFFVEVAATIGTYPLAVFTTQRNERQLKQ